MTTTTDDAFVSKTTQELLNAREAMEIEMQAIASRLTAPNAPGLRGALTDADGFPIAGCDLYAVRADRGRYDGACEDAPTIRLTFTRVRTR